MRLASDCKLNIGQLATWACLLEVSAPKVGNVHRAADFVDMTFFDLAASAVAIGPIMEQARSQTVGDTVLQAVHATQLVTTVNTNLGTLLLLAPLAAIPREISCAQGIAQITASLTVSDTEQVFEAIRQATPGGLGTSASYDVRESCSVDLATAMAHAADRDMISYQYANNFTTIFEEVAGRLSFLTTAGWPIDKSIAHVQLELMSRYPDSLIARKCGVTRAEESASRAAIVLASGPAGSLDYVQSLNGFDAWLRSDGNRRNPGTTADLIAAGLFVALRDGLIKQPLKWD